MCFPENNGKQKETELRREKKNLKSIVCEFSVVAGNIGHHSRQGREEKKKVDRIHPFVGIA